MVFEPRSVLLAATMSYSEAAASRVRKALAGRKEIIEKELFGGIAFLLGGNMCVGVHGDDLIVRIEPSTTAAMLKEPGAKPFDLAGRPGMAGWLLVAPAGYRTEAALETWVSRGVGFASSLPRKPSGRKR
jgi:TfoX/Sxy family transcriptional regulator of competence genes